MRDPARLKKGCYGDFLDEEFYITGKQLLAIFFIVVLFFALCFIAVPQTFGFF